MSAAAVLQRLQAVDSRLAALASETAALEASMAHDEELERMRETLSGAEQDRRQADEAAAGTEARAAELRRRASSIQRRLYDGSIGNPQELLTLQHELEGLRHRAADEEDRLLADMEVAESAASVAAAAHADVVERERARTEAAGPSAERLAALTLAAEEVRTERESVAAEAEPAALSLYARLSNRVRPAVVRLQGDSCGGCRHSLGRHEVHEVRVAARIVQCPECDRILVP